MLGLGLPLTSRKTWQMSAPLPPLNASIVCDNILSLMGGHTDSRADGALMVELRHVASCLEGEVPAGPLPAEGLTLLRAEGCALHLDGVHILVP